MNALRAVRAAARVRPSTACLPLQRRGYADAVSDKIKLTLALPHQVNIIPDAISMPSLFICYILQSRADCSNYSVHIQIYRRVCCSIQSPSHGLVIQKHG